MAEHCPELDGNKRNVLETTVSYRTRARLTPTLTHVVTYELVTSGAEDRAMSAGPAQAFVDKQPPQGPVPNGRANENLQQLAILYLRKPSLQDIVIHMEPGDANGIRVLITLQVNLANL